MMFATRTNSLVFRRLSHCDSGSCGQTPLVHRQPQLRLRRTGPVKFVLSCNHSERSISPDPSSSTDESTEGLRPSNTGSHGSSIENSADHSSKGSDGDADLGTPIPHDNLPPELQNLRITEDGELIDDLTGKTVNAFGASRWDVGVRAMRGELDPPSWVEDTEASQGNIMAALFQFPREHCFQVVGSGGESFVTDAIEIVEQTCQETIVREKLKVTSRLGGKYSSIMMDIRVRAPEIIEMVHEQLKKDPRVKMCY